MFGFIPGLGTPEMIVLLVLGILLFGRKLPELGRSVGKTLVEFKKGMKGIEDEVHESSAPRASIEPEPVRPPQRVTPSSKPVFDDAPAAPTASSVPPKI